MPPAAEIRKIQPSANYYRCNFVAATVAQAKGQSAFRPGDKKKRAGEDPRGVRLNYGRGIWTGPQPRIRSLASV